MKLLRMTATFGRLDHETLTLTDGLNLLQLPNEAGKVYMGGIPARHVLWHRYLRAGKRRACCPSRPNTSTLERQSDGGHDRA